MTLLPDPPDGDRCDDLTVAGVAMSRRQVSEWATALAGQIHGARSAAVRATASLETVVAVLAGLTAGVPVVPVPADAGRAELDHILADSGADVILGDEPVAGRPTIQITGAPASNQSFAEPDARTTALILYTSGTTGRPKGVPVTRAAIAANIDALADAWAWTPADVLVHGLPLYHVHGLVLGVLGPLRLGCRLVHTATPTPKRYAEVSRGSLFFGVPTVWSRIADHADAVRALKSARLLVSGSAALPAHVFAAIKERSGHEIVERYGMTETLITISARADGPRIPGQVGKPLAGVETRIADAQGNQGIGELEVRSPAVFAGYLNRPDATATAFSDDGWFRTGDIASIDLDGVHRIVGRASTDLIKSGGFRIGAGEVEDALLTHPAVREAAVIGVAHADLGEEIVAYVVGEPVPERELIDHVATSLAVHKRPRRVVWLESLPRNAMGKIQKQALR